MKENLKLASGFEVPRAIAARTVFVAGTKGSGKTYNAGVMAEEMLDAGVHVVILDPLGVWWGLRHDADGGPGGFPIVILGGEHADVPLLPTGGDTAAEFIVRSGQSCIIDMSGFDSDAEQDRFVTAMLKRLFRLKATDKANLHIIMDEADMFAPQNPMPGQQVMLGATKTIVTKGRSRGLSMTMITQRPQAIAAALRDEADVFLCHRIQGPRAADAVETWVEQHATAEQAKSFMASLPTLKDGECWVWSPNFLKRFDRVKFRPKRTFDSSRTPDPGETVRKPKAAAKVDLEKLTAEMKATAEQVKASDPKELQRQLADLRKQLAAVGTAKTVETVKVKEVQILADSHVKRLETIAGKLEGEGRKLVETGEKMLAEAAAVRHTVTSATARMAGVQVAPMNSVPRRPAMAQPVRIHKPTPRPPADAPDGNLGKCERAILRVLSQFPEGCQRGKLTILAGYTYSGGFRNSLSELRSRGMIVGGNEETMRITDEGMKMGPFEELPTGQALVDYWLGHQSLGKCEREVFRALADAWPNGMTAEEICRETGYEFSGGFRNALSTLRTVGIIEGRNRRSNLPQQCLVCGKKQFQLHHTTYRNIGREVLVTLRPLCNNHHTAVHQTMRRLNIPLDRTDDAIRWIARNFDIADIEDRLAPFQPVVVEISEAEMDDMRAEQLAGTPPTLA